MSPQPPERPVFRHLDLFRVEDGDERGVVLTDPIGLVSGQAFLPEGLLPVVGKFDGVRTVEQIRVELERECEQEVPRSFVDGLVRQLDEALLLLSPRYEEALDAAARELTSSSARPARHAGSAGYPAEAGALREALDSMVRRGEAPRRPAPRGLIAPHIDLARGREGYAQAYGYLSECEPPDLFVVFGTGHQGPGGVVTGLPADWQTPIGTARTDRAFIAEIHSRLGEPHPHDLFLHRQEHSVEFQMLFLCHVMDGRPFEVAGFLTGSLGQSADLEAVLAAFRASVAATRKRVCFVAGADLAHLGPLFGDAEPVRAERLTSLATTESERLACLQRGDPDAFRQAVEAAGNPDRVCGTSAIYLAAALAGGGAELLHYGQAPAADGSQVVSFCSMAYEANSAGV